jgi:hypothetical protein
VYHQKDGWTGSSWVKTRSEFAEVAAQERGHAACYKSEEADTNFHGSMKAPKMTPIKSSSRPGSATKGFAGMLQSPRRVAAVVPGT